MKSLFKSFLAPSPVEVEKAWLSDDTIFIFDTNVLLNLYGFEEQTREDFFSMVDRLGNRIFVPYHVGLEYNLQRLSVIRNEKKTFRELNSVTETLQKKLVKDLDNLRLKEKFPEVSRLSQELTTDIQLAIAKFNSSIEPWDKKQPDVRSEDNILNLIDKFSDGRIGNPPADQKWLDDLYTEGADRYVNKIPPGFLDTSKDSDNQEPTFRHNNLTYQRKYGDLIIWKQILDEAARASVKNVYFITDDAKDDWWAKIDSGGKKIIGPHEALRSEIYSLPLVETFHMYSTSDFLEVGGKFLDIKINISSIEDANTKHTQPDETDLDIGLSLEEIEILSKAMTQWPIYKKNKLRKSPFSVNKHELLSNTLEDSKFKFPYYKTNKRSNFTSENSTSYSAIESIRQAVENEVAQQLYNKAMKDTLKEFRAGLDNTDTDTDENLNGK
ncbi:PIN-like domain-containing protein [Pseudomonas syringae]|uniref:PIN-like domain-containing protein n=1 Tax=Pseudomonas syringae TaxID=317 RepID=UPI003F7A1632